MKAKVLVSFAGVKYSGIPGDVIDIADKEVYKDLLKAGYIEAQKTAKTTKNDK